MIDWDAVCEGLIEAGICGANAEADLYHVEGRPLLHGMFGVSKGEMEMGHDVHRLIMNLVPLNNICRGIQGDVATLPAWSSSGSLFLMPTEDLLISSEDVRRFSPHLCVGFLFLVLHSRLLLLPSSRRPPPPQHTHTTSSHTTCPHRTCPHTPCSHTTCPDTTCLHLLTHNLSTQNLSTHTLLTHNLSTHNLSTLTHTELAHTQLVHTYSHTTCPHRTCPHTPCSHTTCPHTTCPHLLTRNLSTQNLLTHNLSTGALGPEWTRWPPRLLAWQA